MATQALFWLNSEFLNDCSERVAKSLLPQLTGEEKKRLDKRGTNNPQAYEAYLRGRFFWNQFVAESFPKAIESFQKAVELDPNYALAYVGGILGNWFYGK